MIFIDSMSVIAKSYGKPEKPDPIFLDESESDPQHKVTFTKICKEINGFKETERRFKRSYSYTTGLL